VAKNGPSEPKSDSRSEKLPAVASRPTLDLWASPADEPLERRALRARLVEAIETWLKKFKSKKTRENYAMDLAQFLDFIDAPVDEPEILVAVRSNAISSWRDRLLEAGLTDSSVLRKMTTLRSLYSYLQTYGYLGANPAHSDFVDFPTVPRDGKTIGLSPKDCRRLLDAPDPHTPVGLPDRALLAVLAYSACRVGELVTLRLCDLKSHSGHRILEVMGKGRKARRIALHPEAVERLEV
jgi:integrase/recombinase XerD